MPRGAKSAYTVNQKRQTAAKGGPKAEARAWASVNKLPGGSKKIDARRKVPSGNIGGSGRKTNLSRSS